MPDWLAGPQATAIANLLAIVTTIVVVGRWLAPRVQTLLAGVSGRYRRARIVALETRIAFIDASVATPNGLVARCLRELLTVVVGLVALLATGVGWGFASSASSLSDGTLAGVFAGVFGGVAGLTVNAALSLLRNIALLRDPTRQADEARARLTALRAESD